MNPDRYTTSKAAVQMRCAYYMAAFTPYHSECGKATVGVSRVIPNTKKLEQMFLWRYVHFGLYDLAED